MNYFKKMLGHTHSPPRVGTVEILWSWLGSFLGIALVALIHYKLLDQTALMHLTKTLHPPGGATALIAVIGGDGVHQLGYLYVLVPAGLGAVVMLIVALLVNNIAPARCYPEFWL